MELSVPKRFRAASGGTIPVGITTFDATWQKWYSKRMDKRQTAIYRMTDRRNDDFVPGTHADRIGIVWPMTREISSLSKNHNAERRLQRHVTRPIRREGVEVHIPSIDDLIQNKRASGRTKDIADAEALELLKGSEQEKD